MGIFHMPIPATTSRKASVWESFENYAKEERPLQPVCKIVVKGSIDVDVGDLINSDKGGST
jgi:hypothetical protein